MLQDKLPIRHWITKPQDATGKRSWFSASSCVLISHKIGRMNMKKIFWGIHSFLKLPETWAAFQDEHCRRLWILTSSMNPSLSIQRKIRTKATKVAIEPTLSVFMHFTSTNFGTSTWNGISKILWSTTCCCCKDRPCSTGTLEGIRHVFTG